MALWAVALLAACMAEGPSFRVTGRDSAGIRIVENPPPSTSGNEWTLDSVPVVELGADPSDPTQQFVRVGDVLLLDEDRIAVADEGADEVWMFHVAADSAHIIGHRGEGPGELTDVHGVYRCAGDTLVVNDTYRVNVFDREGGFARTERLMAMDEGDLPRIGGVSRDCSTFLLRTRDQVLPGPGEVSTRASTLYWGSLDNTRRVDVATVPTRDIVRRSINGMDQALTVPWSKQAHWAVGREHVYVGTSDRAEIRVYDREARLIRLLRWAGGRRPVTKADRQLFARKRTRWIEERRGYAEVLRPLDDFPAVPDEMPAFLSLLVDDRENLWVRGYPRWVAGWPEFYESDLRDPPDPDGEPETWIVFDSTGAILATVRIRPDLSIRSVYDDYVLAVWRDQYDVDHVRLYRLNKGGPR